jgi:sulfatase maturation enzyme AslB (radical SAM superfamily)
MHPNKIFCTAPFTTLRIESFADRGVIFKPGCVYQAQQSIPTLDEFLSGSEMQDLRNNKLTGAVPNPGCFSCSMPESMGLTSIRQQLLNKPWAGADKKIYMLDIFFGNTCNLGCVMCSPDFSSYIAEERYQAGMIPIRSSAAEASADNIQLALDTMDQLPDLKSVTFLGGEFFLVKRNAEILDKIIQKNIQCTITTNATVLTEPLLQKLQHIQDLQIRISVDGIGDVYDFIRYPADWNVLDQNIDVLKKRFNWAEFHISIVVQPLNIQNLHELLEWANKKIIPTHYQVLAGPRHLTWQILTSEEKHSIVELLKTKQTKHKITNKQKIVIDDLINGIVQDGFDPELRVQGVEFLSKILAHRKISTDVVLKQFGILTDLANEIIMAMKTQ